MLRLIERGRQMVWSWKDRNKGREPRQVSSRLEDEEAGNARHDEMSHLETIENKI